ncbi:MAG: hypothetical protein ACC662_10965, partial [Planctomycetota bacterium]
MARKHRIESPPEPPSTVRRYVIVAGIVVVLAGVAALLFLPRFRVGRWIADLHSDNPRTVTAARVRLAGSDLEGLNDTLYDLLVDSGAAFRVRRLAGRILLQRNRLGLLERGLRLDDAAEREAALAALHG